jgi:hypothetical protein
MREQVRVTAGGMRGGCVRGCPRAELAPPEGVLSPRARRTLLEGQVEPSSGADPARGSVYPSSEANLTRGGSAAWYWRAAGATMVAVMLCRRLGARVDLCFTFFAGFKRVSPWLFRGPLGLSLTNKTWNLPGDTRQFRIYGYKAS